MSIKAIAVTACTALMASAAQAEVVMEWVVVGDQGNADDIHGDGYGGVDYVFRMGKYEVTNGQYRELLNAVASTGDPNGLYNPDMGGLCGGIARTGSGTAGDPWVYAPKDGDGAWDQQPVNQTSFYDALRFANWLHNGQPAGTQDATTTEAGAYLLSGPTEVAECVPGVALHCPDAEYWVPTEDEWYKAAYYKGGGVNAGYWDFATRSDTMPTREAPPGTDMVNGSAQYDDPALAIIGLPYCTSPVGSYTGKPSDTAYGTYDQNGSMWEWHEEPFNETLQGRRGGSFINHGDILAAPIRTGQVPTEEDIDVGFRLARAGGADPIPTMSEWGVVCLTLLVLTAGTVAYSRQRPTRA